MRWPILALMAFVLFTPTLKRCRLRAEFPISWRPFMSCRLCSRRRTAESSTIVADAYARNGGTGLPRVVLPGLAALTNAGTLDPYGVAYGGGRADVRLSVDKDGELYLLSKTDGMIRKLTGVVTPPPSGPR